MRAVSVHKRKPSPGDLPIQRLKIKRQTNKNMHVGETVTNFDHKESTRKNCESCGKQRLAHEWFVFDGPKPLLKNKVLLNDNDDQI